MFEDLLWCTDNKYLCRCLFCRQDACSNRLGRNKV